MLKGGDGDRVRLWRAESARVFGAREPRLLPRWCRPPDGGLTHLPSNAAQCPQQNAPIVEDGAQGSTPHPR